MMKYWLCGFLIVAAAGCSSTDAEIKAITPDLAQQIAAEDSEVNQEESGRGAIRD